jgi:NitT/TauT family transport system permease protein
MNKNGTGSANRGGRMPRLRQSWNELTDRRGVQPTIAYAVSLLLLLALWEIASLVVRAVYGSPFLPAPSVVFRAMILNAPGLGWDFLLTGWRLVLSMLIALAIGVPVGLMIGHERILDRYLSPMIYIIYPIPQVALILFLFLLFGTGNATKVALVTLVLFFQVVVTARGAAKNLPQEHLTSVRATGATRWQVYRHVVLPASLPDILTSARVAIGLGMALLYIAETQSERGGGLGLFISRKIVFARETAFAGIVAMAILGLLLYLAIDFAEHVLCRWKYTGGRSR